MRTFAERREAMRAADAKWRANRTQEQRDRANARKRATRAAIRAGAYVPRNHIHEHPSRPSPEAIRARDLARERMNMLQDDPNIMLLGDPPPWRSALGTRNGSYGV